MAEDVAQMTMAFFRLQVPVLPRKYDRDENVPGEEDVFAGVEREDLVDTWLYRDQLAFITRKYHLSTVPPARLLLVWPRAFERVKGPTLGA
jgi:hypothetical protein